MRKSVHRGWMNFALSRTALTQKKRQGTCRLNSEMKLEHLLLIDEPTFPCICSLASIFIIYSSFYQVQNRLLFIFGIIFFFSLSLKSVECCNNKTDVSIDGILIPLGLLCRCWSRRVKFWATCISSYLFRRRNFFSGKQFHPLIFWNLLLSQHLLKAVLMLRFCFTGDSSKQPKHLPRYSSNPSYRPKIWSKDKKAEFPYSFLCQGPSLEMEFLANYLGELTLIEYSFVKFLPSIIAASAVLLARWTLDQSDNPWVHNLLIFCGTPTANQEIIHFFFEIVRIISLIKWILVAESNFGTLHKL